jgi:starch-binding outer membrane protein, SusD/RagB family
MKRIYITLIAALIALSGCEDYLDRKNLDTLDESNFWTSEGNMRLFATGTYTTYFYGFGSGNAHGNFFTFGPWADEYSSSALWTVNTPTSAATTWTFTRVRRHNLMLARLENMPGTEEVKSHWRGIGRFFRAMEYADLAFTYGDVPWYDKEILPSEVELAFKDRDPLPFVATKIMEDFEYAAGSYVNGTLVPTVRLNDGALQVNRDVVLAFMSRHLLNLGTLLKHHNIDHDVAKTLLEKAKWAAEELIKDNKYQIVDDYRGIFTSADLTSNKEVIFFRQYETAKNTHAMIQYVNGEGQTGTTLKVVETYLAADGLPIKQSPVYNYSSDNGLRFYPDQYKNRDPRMAATLVDSIRIGGAHSAASTTGFLCWKFLPYAANRTDLVYQSTNSITDAPVIRFGEVLLNYAEAAAELGQFTQADADKTINKLRGRSIRKNNAGNPLAKLPPMTVNGDKVFANGVEINDPDRDPNVSSLLWEIRRERAVELIFEGFRKSDLKRWKKFEYLKTIEGALGPTTLGKGAYVDLSKFNATTKANILKTTRFVYPIPGNTDLGFIHNLYEPNMRRNWIPGEPSYEKQYRNGVPLDQINMYQSRGYTLTQNPGLD